MITNCFCKRMLISMLLPALLIVLSFDNRVSHAQSPELKNGENFLVPLITGWKLAWANKGRGWQAVEFVPKGEELKSWSQLVTVQIYYNQNQLHPLAFSATMSQNFERGCDKVKTETSAAEKQNGYLTAEVVLACTREKKTGKGSLTIIRSFAGRDSFYVVQWATRVNPYPLGQKPVGQDVIENWRDFLKSAKLCDTRRDKQRCNMEGWSHIWPRPKN